jgi:8-amino-7-oxononanoate synthase
MTQIDTSPLAWLDAVEQQRRQAGLRRALRPRPAVATELDLASNDYLGLSQHPEVIDGGVDALRTWGAGATGSRLVTGNTLLHEEFESELAEFVGAAAGLVFSSGYAANLGAVVGLSGPGSVLVSDAYSHASLVDACRLSRARVVVTPHRDVDAVDAALASRDEERAVVITESVFSTDGALAPVRRLHEVCRRHRALLIVDEAHGLGVRGPGGRGLLHELGLTGAPDVVMTTTLSKALGSQGGAVLASAAVRDHLIDAARPFIFDTGLAPAAVGAALAALRVLSAEAWRPEAVLRHAGTLAQICDVALGDDAGRRASRGGGTSRLRGRGGQSGPDAPQSAVVSVVLGEPEVALAAATACLDAGVRVGCFRPPTVPAGTSRLRLTARASLDADDIELARTVLTDVLHAARR